MSDLWAEPNVLNVSIVIYGIVALILLVVGIGMRTDGDYRDGARLMFAAPVWPIFAAIFMWLFLKDAWDDAEWGKR